MTPSVVIIAGAYAVASSGGRSSPVPPQRWPARASQATTPTPAHSLTRRWQTVLVLIMTAALIGAL